MLLQLTGDAEIFSAIRTRATDLIWSVEEGKPFFVSIPALMRILQIDYKAGPNFPFDLFTCAPNGAPGAYIDIQCATPQGLAMKNSDRIYIARRIPGKVVFSPPLPTTPVLAKSKLSIRVILLDTHNREMALPAGSRVTLSTSPMECLVTQNVSSTVPMDAPLSQLPSHMIFGTVSLACITRPKQIVQVMATLTGPGIPPHVERAEGSVAVSVDPGEAPAPTTTTNLAAPTITPPSGTYPYGICVVLGESEDADPTDLLVFTADGSDPATSGVRYVGPFYINACGPLTIKALRASSNNAVCSPVSRVDYHLTPAKPILTGDPSQGSRGEATLSIADKPPREGTLEIRYTVDGTMPTPHSHLYSAPVRYSEVASGTLKACTVWCPSPVQRRAGTLHCLSECVSLDLFGSGSRMPPQNPADIPYVPYTEPPCPMPVPSTYRPQPSNVAGPTSQWMLRSLVRTGIPYETVLTRLQQLIVMICSVKLNSVTAVDQRGGKPIPPALLSAAVSPPRNRGPPEYYGTPGGPVYAFNTRVASPSARSHHTHESPAPKAPSVPRFHRWVSELHPM
jgi:hypothetical protein